MDARTSRFGPCLAIAVALAALWPAATAEASLRGRLNGLMSHAGRYSGAMVVDATTGRTIFSRKPGVPRSLASNTKLFTTATALEKFGPASRLETSVWATGGGDAAAAAEPLISGSLYLKGGGDPALGSEAFANRYLGGLVTRAIALADLIQRLGIRRVEGNLFADDTLFDRLRGVPYSGFRVTRYIGPLSALSYNSGFAGDLERRFAPDPAVFAAGQLKDALRRRGVVVAGKVALRPLPASAQKLAYIRSPRMADLIRETNVPSNNFFAEMLLKGIGARFGGAGTTRAGTRVVRDFAAGAGSRIQAVDGSGLTRGNTASPRAVVALLRTMRGRPNAPSYLGSLPVAGRQGTLRRRMRGTAAQDNCRAKTGTINGVSALSGFCRTRAGHDLAFSFLMNRVGVAGARRIQDRMAVALASSR
jgi:D-alanyl-D-alanine carboxypeptidase/D-alanyl-D-alanine-endopeptidase (penicillin-binding protein 4)